MVLGTSGQAADLKWMLPAIGVDEDVITGSTTSADVEVAKPAPDLLQVAMEQHGLDPARTVAVGDTVWDVQATHDAGLPIVAFTCGGIPRCQLEGARADEIYAGPADLLDHWAESVLARLCWVPVGVRTPVCRPKRPYGGRNRRLGPRCRHKRLYGFRLAS